MAQGLWSQLQMFLWRGDSHDLIKATGVENMQTKIAYYRFIKKCLFSYDCEHKESVVPHG